MRAVYGVKPRNEGQQEALEALVDQSVNLVVLDGIAGSGKTLLALAAGLHQVLDTKVYSQIVWTRPTVGIGSDIGFLPGTEEEKMICWMGALYDNLEVLHKSATSTKFGKEAMGMILRDRIKMLSLMFMRGRSFQDRYIVIDETQNLFPAEIKTLLCRAGENSKVVLLGDSQQIDNKKLSLDFNGIQSILQVEHLPEFIKIIQLEECERSPLAKWAASFL